MSKTGRYTNVVCNEIQILYSEQNPSPRLLHHPLPPRSYLVFSDMCLSCAFGAVRRVRPVAPEKNRGSQNYLFQSEFEI